MSARFSLGVVRYLKTAFRLPELMQCGRAKEGQGAKRHCWQQFVRGYSNVSLLSPQAEKHASYKDGVASGLYKTAVQEEQVNPASFSSPESHTDDIVQAEVEAAKREERRLLQERIKAEQAERDRELERLQDPVPSRATVAEEVESSNDSIRKPEPKTSTHAELLDREETAWATGGDSDGDDEFGPLPAPYGSDDDGICIVRCTATFLY